MNTNDLIVLAADEPNENLDEILRNAKPDPGPLDGLNPLIATLLPPTLWIIGIVAFVSGLAILYKVAASGARGDSEVLAKSSKLLIPAGIALVALGVIGPVAASFI